MKLLPLLLLFLSACSALPLNRTASYPPQPERKANEFISRDVDRIAELGGLPPLSESRSAADIEIRIWYGLGRYCQLNARRNRISCSDKMNPPFFIWLINEPWRKSPLPIRRILISSLIGNRGLCTDVFPLGNVS
jgi:hypothetical protein